MQLNFTAVFFLLYFCYYEHKNVPFDLDMCTRMGLFGLYTWQSLGKLWELISAQKTNNGSGLYQLNSIMNVISLAINTAAMGAWWSMSIPTDRSIHSNLMETQKRYIFNHIFPIKAMTLPIEFHLGCHLFSHKHSLPCFMFMSIIVYIH